MTHFQRAEQIRGVPVSVPSFILFPLPGTPLCSPPPLYSFSSFKAPPEAAWALLLGALLALSSHRTYFHGEDSLRSRLNRLPLSAFCVETLPTNTISSMRAGKIAYMPFSPRAVMESGFSEGEGE